MSRVRIFQHTFWNVTYPLNQQFVKAFLALGGLGIPNPPEKKSKGFFLSPFSRNISARQVDHEMPKSSHIVPSGVVDEISTLGVTETTVFAERPVKNTGMSCWYLK